jgi:hypothetical protein
MSLAREKIVLITTLIFILVIYLAFPTRNYYWDGIEFAQLIENADSLNASLLHPNHLFYNSVGYIFYKSVTALGINARAITVLQTVNSILSVFAAAALFRILKTSLRSNYLTVTLTFLFAFSALWWKFSTDANSYVPSVLFVIISFYLIHPARKAKPPAVALTHTAAMCFHQLAVFFFPVIVLGIYFQNSKQSGRRKVRDVISYGATAFVLTFGAYAGSFYWQTGNTSLRELFGWLTYYSPEHGFSDSFKDCLRYNYRRSVKTLFRRTV